MGNKSSGPAKPGVFQPVKRKSRPRGQMKRCNAKGSDPETLTILQTTAGNMKELYTLGKELGHGDLGTTYLCTENSTGNQYACKTIPKRRLIMQEDIENVRMEIQIMHHMAGQPNVISVVGVYEDRVSVSVVMELCTGGELFDRIVERGCYSEKKASDISRVVVGVVEACHSLGVMHRDLKPEKFLFVNEDEESVLKTNHFGLSVFFKPGIFVHSKIDCCVMQLVRFRL
ncbi:putative protein kinase CAMK-CDPK family [Helianthus annuus]|nr:putative protein kinase CAMK-CDPK family [Helianthus annuus]